MSASTFEIHKRNILVLELWNYKKTREKEQFFHKIIIINSKCHLENTSKFINPWQFNNPLRLSKNTQDFLNLFSTITCVLIEKLIWNDRMFSYNSNVIEYVLQPAVYLYSYMLTTCRQFHEKRTKSPTWWLHIPTFNYLNVVKI